MNVALVVLSRPSNIRLQSDITDFAGKNRDLHNRKAEEESWKFVNSVATL